MSAAAIASKGLVFEGFPGVEWSGLGRWLQAACCCLALFGAATALLDRPLTPRPREAVARLADVTQTAVIGTAGSGAPATRSWRGRSAVTAWRAPSAGDANRVLACELLDWHTVCRVWLGSIAPVSRAL